MYLMRKDTACIRQELKTEKIQSHGNQSGWKTNVYGILASKKPIIGVIPVYNMNLTLIP